MVGQKPAISHSLENQLSIPVHITFLSASDKIMSINFVEKINWKKALPLENTAFLNNKLITLSVS